MYNSLFFATFDPVYVNAPEICELCVSQPPIFNYEYCIEETDGKREYIKGFCCASCAGDLLMKLKNREAREWADEEAELEADNVDVTDFKSAVWPLSARANGSCHSERSEESLFQAHLSIGMLRFAQHDNSC